LETDVVLTAPRLRIAFPDRPGVLDFPAAVLVDRVPPDLVAAFRFAGPLARVFMVSGFFLAAFFIGIRPRASMFVKIPGCQAVDRPGKG
jgi:hypothetical protein